MCTFTTLLFLYSESQTSYLWDNFAFQPFQYIRERLLCLARLLTPNFFRKYLFTQSACDRAEKLQENDTESVSNDELVMTDILS